MNKSHLKKEKSLRPAEKLCLVIWGKKRKSMTREHILPQRRCKGIETHTRRQLHEQFPALCLKTVASKTDSHSIFVGITLLDRNMLIYTSHWSASFIYKETSPVLITPFCVLVFMSIPTVCIWKLPTIHAKLSKIHEVGKKSRFPWLQP